MAEQFVCKFSEFKDGDRRIVRVGSHEIGVFNHNGEIFAYSRSIDPRRCRGSMPVAAIEASRFLGRLRR